MKKTVKGLVITLLFAVLLNAVVFTPKAAPTSLLGTDPLSRVNVAGHVMLQRPKANVFNINIILQSPIKYHEAYRNGSNPINVSTVRFLPNRSAMAPLGIWVTRFRRFWAVKNNAICEADNA